MSKCLKNYLTYRRIFSRLSIVKTSFSLHSLLENLVMSKIIPIFAHKEYYKRRYETNQNNI